MATTNVADLSIAGRYSLRLTYRRTWRPTSASSTLPSSFNTSTTSPKCPNMANFSTRHPDSRCWFNRLRLTSSRMRGRVRPRRSYDNPIVIPEKCYRASPVFPNPQIPPLPSERVNLLIPLMAHSNPPIFSRYRAAAQRGPHRAQKCMSSLPPLYRETGRMLPFIKRH